MDRTTSAEKNAQVWYRGQVFSGSGCDPEFRKIARGFLCGDVTPSGQAELGCFPHRAHRGPGGSSPGPLLSWTLRGHRATCPWKSSLMT